jgi:hypothetical protein
MALKFTRSILVVSFILVLVTTLIPIGNVKALNSQFHASNLTLLNLFVSQVTNGQADELRGVYVPGIFAARVIQQPDGNDEFVSSRQNILTQFELASQFGATGLLAHNDLAGERFFLLNKGRIFYLVYGDGQIAAFIVTEILRYQALEPNNTSSKFMNLENYDLLTAPELFSKVYTRSRQVIFQTCIAEGENLSWGRLFVNAEPYSHKP